MAMVSANGVELKVMRLGPDEPAAPPVVLLHGIVIDNLSSLYFTLANHIAAEHDTVLYDQRGHGRSSVPPTGYRIADSVADLAGLLDALGIDEPVVLVGNSFGGTVALAFAVAHPERVAGLVLIEAHFAVEGWGEQMYTMLHRAVAIAHEGLSLEPVVRETGQVPEGSLEDLNKVGLSQEEVLFIRGWAQSTGMRKAITMAKTVIALVDGTTIADDLRAERPVDGSTFRSITCPALVLYGENSDIIQRGRDLASWLPGAELVVLPGHDHSVLMSATDELREQILPWLAARRLAAGARGRGRGERGRGARRRGARAVRVRGVRVLGATQRDRRAACLPVPAGPAEPWPGSSSSSRRCTGTPTRRLPSAASSRPAVTTWPGAGTGRSWSRWSPRGRPCSAGRRPPPGS